MDMPEFDEKPIQIPIGHTRLIEGDLVVPDHSHGMCCSRIEAEAAGTARETRYVAQVVQQDGLATLLMDLLTPEEEALDVGTAALRFDIGFLARRLI